ncbi:hypothetical protein [Nannocystis radixulma]|uniref:Uncharacterized protein n=1 Tax=Nannocystis radixulma TaxID=2995305 RepID=A0ABT5AXN3_9BACT|nr:hypothetical protein [Nannocystis radixulma]MDC0666220.1 hypothetical protein [Nannocystis radixulma]
MSFEYPRRIAAPYGPFGRIADVVKPGDAVQKAYRARPSIPVALGIGDEDGQVHAIRVRSSDLVGVTRLYLSAGPLTSTSVHNGRSTDKPAAIDKFWFCPGADAVAVSWKVRHPDDIDHAVLTVRASRLDGFVSRVRIETADLVNGRGVVAGCTGGKPLAQLLDLQHGQHPDQFPRQLLTVEHSPYRFELTIVKKNGSEHEAYPTTAWTFAHVLVHSITLERGELGHVPDGPPPGVDPVLAVRGERVERALVGRFLTALAPLATDDTIVLDASVHSATHVDLGQPLDPKPSDVHQGVKALWGEGPRFPLKARIMVRRASGAAATSFESGHALGKVKLMWDWRDDPARVDQWLRGNRGEYSYISRSYIDSMMATPTAGPRGSANCPSRYGGRRGASTQVFQACAPGRAGSCEVSHASAARPWAAISEVGIGPYANQSAVLFTPGIIAGDQYKIAVYLTSSEEYPTYNDDDKPVLHVAEPDGQRFADAIAALHPDRRPPLAETGTFTLERRSEVMLLEDNAGANAGAQAATRQAYKTFAGLNLNVATGPLRADLWQNDHTGAPLAYDELMAGVRSNLDSLVPLLAFIRPPPVVGPHLIAVRSLRELLDLLRRLLREGGGYVAETGGRPVGEFHRFGATEAYLLAGFTPAVNPSGTVHQALLVQRGALPAPGTVSTNQLWALGRWRRLCFSAENWVDDFAAGHAEGRVIVAFASAGLVERATLNYPSGKLGRVERTAPDDAAQLVGAALDLLVAALPVFDEPLTITVTARNRNDRDAERIRRAKEIVRPCLRERFEALDVEGVVSALMAAPFGRANDPVPLDAEGYWSAVKGGVKLMTLELLERIRGRELPNQEGLIYLDITQQAAEGVFPGGGNMLISFPTTNPPRIWTTLFKGVGYQVLQSRSTTDYALQAFCSAEDTMVHEFGHAYWRAHAPRAVWGFTKFAGDAFQEHVPHDTCLMNYDVDPGRYFCGRCVLALRGWDNLPLADPAVATAADAIPLLQADIDAEADVTRKAWKQLRRAYLIEKRGDPGSATNEITQAVSTLGVRDGSPGHVAFRRAAIRGYLQNGTEQLIEWFARPLWRELIALRPRFADLCDADHTNTPFFAGLPWKVELLEEYGVAAAPARQYVNLAREPRFVDGHRVTSVDRLGTRLRCKISFSTPGNYRVRYRLVGHDGDPYPPGGALEPGFESNDDHYTIPIGPVWNVVVAAARSTTVEIDLAGLVRPGSRVRLLAHDLVSDECGESPVIEVRQLLFYVKLTAAGSASHQVFDNDDAFTAGLDAAYRVAGIEFVHLGAEDLRLTDFHYDPSKTKLTPLMQEIDGVSDAACRAPFTPLAPNYRDYRPHLYVFVFVDTVVYRIGRKQAQRALAGHDPAQPVSFLLRDLGAEFVSGVLWDGQSPGTLAEERLQRDRLGQLTEPYAGAGVVGKEWVVSASFTGADGMETPLVLGELATAEGNPALPGRLNQIDVDLGRFAGGDGLVTGTIKVEFLWAAFQGGVSVKDDSAHRNVAVISTRPSYDIHAFAARVQHSAAIHEIGHALGMVPDTQATHFNINGSGPHCRKGLPVPQGNQAHDSDFYAARLAQATCVMFYRLRPFNTLLTFCADCEVSLRELDLRAGFR